MVKCSGNRSFQRPASRANQPRDPPISTVAERIYQTAKPLPEPLAREALRYIEYLRFRAERGDFLDWLSAQETALNKVWNSEEDEDWNNAPTL